MPKRRVKLPQSEKRQWKVLLAVLSAAAVLVIGLMLLQAGSTLNLRSLWDDGSEARRRDELAAASLAAENEFKGRIIVTVPTEEDLAPLRRAVETQRELVEATGRRDISAVNRLSQLEGVLAETEGKALVAVVSEAEAAAEESLRAGDAVGARAALQRAYEAQRRINGSRATALRNTTKEASFVRQMQNLEARPLAEASIAAEERARSLAASEKWSESLDAFNEARELQLRINREYMNSGFANTARLERLDVELASFSTGGLIQEIQKLMERGREAASQGGHGEAALAYRGALERQLRINSEFPKSRFANRERVEEIRILVESSESWPTAQRVLAEDAAATEALRNQQIDDARGAISRATEALNSFQTGFRRSTLLDEETKFRITYLNQIQQSFAQIQGRILRGLAPIENGTAQLLTTEVDQALFQSVMLANPSRNIGDKLPVESVSFDEATDFCRRLGWILARPVRLPSVDEFRRAAGDFDPNALAGGLAWIGENSSQQSQPVGTSKPTGLHFDILGNVAEWLSTPDSASVAAAVGGGSYVDRASAFREFPVSTRPRADRSRTVGFRVVVLPPVKG